jgi:hypothetical protein
MQRLTAAEGRLRAWDDGLRVMVCLGSSSCRSLDVTARAMFADKGVVSNRLTLHVASRLDAAAED